MLQIYKPLNAGKDTPVHQNVNKCLLNLMMSSKYKLNNKKVERVWRNRQSLFLDRDIDFLKVNLEIPIHNLYYFNQNNFLPHKVLYARPFVTVLFITKKIY